MIMAIHPQGYTNGIHVFDKVIRKVLAQLITQGKCRPFIYDVGVNCQQTDRIGNSTGYEEALPSIRRYVMEVVISLHQTFVDIE